MSAETEISEDAPAPSPEEMVSKGKGKAKEETVPTNYRVYCASRSYFIAESLQIQRFMFPTEMPACLFDIHLHRSDPGTKDVSEDAKARSGRFLDGHHDIVQKLAHTHTEGIFGTRAWPCIVCGAAAVKLLHGLIPHFEVKVGSGGDEDEEQGRGFYGASISVPLTEGRIYRIGVKGGKKDKMTEARRWINRLAVAPISYESEEAQDRLVPCIVDVTTPICSPWCEELANDLRRDLATEILKGTFKVDPEDMPWWAADEGMVPSADLKGASGKIVQCAVCGLVDEMGILKCGGCELVGYCSRNCQKDHWSTHKYHCDEMRDRSHAAILVEMSQAGVEHTGPEAAVDRGTTGAVVRSLEERDENIPQNTGVQDAKTEDGTIDEVPNKSTKKKKNKGKNKGKRKGKGKGKDVDAKDVKNAEPDTLDEADESGTEVGDAIVEAKFDQDQEEIVEVAKKQDTLDEAEESGTEVGDADVKVKVDRDREEIAEEVARKPNATDEGEDKEEGKQEAKEEREQNKEENNKWLPLL